MFGQKICSKLIGNPKEKKFKNLNSTIIELNDYKELMKVFNWRLDPILDVPSTYEFKHELDVNQRRLRDAESLATVVRNIDPKTCLEIGTGKGQTTSLIALNAPNSTIYTVNIPPEDFEKGGEKTTMKLERNEIGRYYREKGFQNIEQIYANTATWDPSTLGAIDVAFIDGCHDTDFVVNDTKKILKYMSPGSFIVWHDFNYSLLDKYNWIHSVCFGVEQLFAMNILKGRIFHIRDSFMGIYQV